MDLWNRGNKRGFPTHGQRRPASGENAAAWKVRDSKILELSYQNPITVRHVAPFFNHGSTAAARRLRKLSQQGKLRFVGSALLTDEGRPSHVYCNGWTPRQQDLRHEVLTTDIVQCYPEAAVRRGPLIRDKKLRADAELTFPDGRYFWVELDTGTEGLKHVRQRFRTYQQHHGSSGLMLFVTLSEIRLEHLIQEAQIVKDIAVFALYADVMAMPNGKVWRSTDGSTGAIT